jgi:hypothetical protein
MVGCPWLKAVLVRAANFTLYHLARLPTHDASNGFRLFSRRVTIEISIESERGFCYSIEFVVKCHRLVWRIGEVPAAGSSGRTEPDGFRWSSGCRIICAGIATRLPRAVCAGRRKPFAASL